MSMGSCQACGKPVATDAKTCPHCGKPDPIPGLPGCVIAILVLGALAILGAITKGC